jgi:hypothetical protein
VPGASASNEALSFSVTIVAGNASRARSNGLVTSRNWCERKQFEYRRIIEVAEACAAYVQADAQG